MQAMNRSKRAPETPPPLLSYRIRGLDAHTQYVYTYFTSKYSYILIISNLTNE